MYKGVGKMTVHFTLAFVFKINGERKEGKC